MYHPHGVNLPHGYGYWEEEPCGFYPGGPSTGEASTSLPAAGCKLRKDSFVHEVYTLGDAETDKLGEGAFSEVVKARHNATGVDVACKIMELPPATDPNHDYYIQEISKEIDILCSLHHPNLLSLIEYFVQGNRIYLFTELVSGGDLMKKLSEEESLDENTTRTIFIQLLRGIEHMHQRNIAHRDLKLDNILLSSSAPDDYRLIKIADFGLAKHVDNRGYFTTVCGSPQYVAPEVVQVHPTAGSSAYGPKVDMWGAGVILYMLLAGYPPFEGDNHNELFSQVRSGKFSFDMPVWNGVTNVAKDLICRLLVVDEKQRLTATEALQHPWLNGYSVAASGRIEARGLSATIKRARKAMKKPFANMGLSFSWKQERPMQM